MGTKKQTKYDIIKNYLLDGNSISSIEAFDKRFGCVTRLSAIIFTMIHRDNIPVESCTEESESGARYSRYWVKKSFLEEMNRVDAAAQEQTAVA